MIPSRAHFFSVSRETLTANQKRILEGLLESGRYLYPASAAIRIITGNNFFGSSKREEIDSLIIEIRDFQKFAGFVALGLEGKK